ncbi:single-stranded DNA-binding protein [Candidatus Woesebacteria bacterium CG_4_10_14_0_2_um_filter_39_14]|uniref:Single-stranded DNA-binding protein n=4 Tax=Candidatus Woeseibacteriota TaxID=1752722 RepID=A0A2M7X9S7_9BACT|nr:MAG: single-stranded DNA-binding protein [Candidatus Woesebacteria bacterium CG_4_10_14_0_2_um_filter_39_14]PJA42904.1 MAG: single-stranded DNA-binding protein [Candidatus Woesebacteria bacterium CG_4_9_14_3_um_filter_39_10]
MARSLNKVQLIGNLTRDPELRYTPSGAAVCTLGLATNRQWVTETGEKKEDAEFHRLVAWNKLAEICSQLLKKGRKIYVEGRLQTRSWQGQDGNQRQTTEIVISDMIILDPKPGTELASARTDELDVPESVGEVVPPVEEKPKKVEKKGKKEVKKDEKTENDEEIPF